MKKLSLVMAFMICLVGFSYAQILNPTSWTYTAKKIGDKTYEIHMTATLGSGWHLYAQDAGEGPEPTAFSFTKNPLVKLDGAVKENGKLIKEYDKNFNSVLKFYANKVDFVQVVKLKTNAATVVKGNVTFMVCNDSKCLPPKTVPFSVKLTS